MSLEICGIKRNKMRFRIREALAEQGMTMAGFARLLGVSRQVVTYTIMGYTHNQRVLEGLRNVGVPEKYLFDPRREQIR